jgi:hypothetical protein
VNDHASAENSRAKPSLEETEMNKFLIAFAGAGVLLLGGCQSAPTTKPAVAEPAKGEAVKQSLSEEAKQALAAAETDVKQAKAQNALWTTAEGALKKAQEAAKKPDSNAVIAFSKTASEQARLGIAQQGYPSTK